MPLHGKSSFNFMGYSVRFRKFGFRNSQVPGLVPKSGGPGIPRDTNLRSGPSPEFLNFGSRSYSWIQDFLILSLGPGPSNFLISPGTGP